MRKSPRHYARLRVALKSRLIDAPCPGIAGEIVHRRRRNKVLATLALAMPASTPASEVLARSLRSTPALTPAFKVLADSIRAVRSEYGANDGSQYGVRSY